MGVEMGVEGLSCFAAVRALRYLFVFSTQRRRAAEALEKRRGREGIAIDALA